MKNLFKVSVEIMENPRRKQTFIVHTNLTGEELHSIVSLRAETMVGSKGLHTSPIEDDWERFELEDSAISVDELVLGIDSFTKGKAVRELIDKQVEPIISHISDIIDDARVLNDDLFETLWEARERISSTVRSLTSSPRHRRREEC